MNKTMTGVIWIFAALFLLAVASPVVAPAAQEEKIKAKTEVQATEGAERKTRGAGEDENIKSKSVKNEMDKEKLPPAPPEKGGDKTRGAWCYLHVDNRTPWKIQIYVDGDYVGLVSPFGTANGSYYAGNKVIYGVAEFTDGPDVTWGPRTAYCTGEYTWNLTYTKLGYR